MSKLVTQDGTCIIIDPVVGEISARSREEAEAELRKRRAYRNVRSDGGLNIIHRHEDIQTGERA